jgi:predicted nucleic acid-binding protein
VLVEAKQKGYISRVKPLLDDLMAKASFWVSHQLYARVLREVGE